jgi:hypothetical protein
MRRLGEVLPEVASTLGIEEELRRARQMAAWQRIVAEMVPPAAGESALLAVHPPALVVSASSPIVAQELRLRASQLLGAFAVAPDGERLVELRVSVRSVHTDGRPTRERGSRDGRYPL